MLFLLRVNAPLLLFLSSRDIIFNILNVAVLMFLWPEFLFLEMIWFYLHSHFLNYFLLAGNIRVFVIILLLRTHYFVNTAWVNAVTARALAQAQAQARALDNGRVHISDVRIAIFIIIHALRIRL